MSNIITLLADIGATNARFAISINHGCLDLVQVLKCEEYPTPVDAINFYLNEHNIVSIDNICFAVAGPVVRGVVNMTNNHWSLDSKQLQAIYRLKKISLLNDFEALAYSVLVLSEQQLLPLNKHHSSANKSDDFAYVILGAGSGLGVSALFKRGANIYPVVTEAGHANFSPVGDLQMAIFKLLIKKHKQVSNEHILSGPGIVNIYQSLCEIEGQQSVHQTAQEICESASNSEDNLCIKSLDIFFEVLGQVAGDLVLTYNAYDGVYIGGGIAPRYSKLMKKSLFNLAFKNKSQHQERLENTPISLIVEPYPGLVGANYYSKSFM